MEKPDWNKLLALKEELKVDVTFAVEYLRDSSLAAFIKDIRDCKQQMPHFPDEVTAPWDVLIERAEKELAERKRRQDILNVHPALRHLYRPPFFNPAPTDIDKLTNDELEYHIMTRRKLISRYSENQLVEGSDIQGFIKKCEEEVTRRKELEKREKNAAAVLSEIYLIRNVTAELRKSVEELEKRLQALEISTQAAFNV